MADPLIAELGLPPSASLTAGKATLRVGGGGSEISVSSATCLRPKGQALLVGRQAATADLRIQHKSLSRQHAVLYYGEEGRLWIQDLGGKHGTLLNQQRLPAKVATQLQQGDELQFANVRESKFVVHYHDKDHQQETAGGETDMASTNAGPMESTAIASEEAATSSAASLVAQAGQGLTGRAKREAELAAMMDSLDQTPTYQSYQRPPSPDAAAEADRADQELQTAQEHNLPISERFFIPCSDEKGSAISCLVLDASGSRFAVGSRDTQRLSLFDFSGMDQQRREPFQTTTPQDGHGVVSCAYSQSGDRLLVGTGSAQPLVLDREGQETILEFVRGDMYVSDQSKTFGHTAAVTGTDWHPLEERDVVLTSSRDGTARLWNVVTGKTQFEKLTCNKVFTAKSKRGQRTAVTSVSFHPGGREFILGTQCGSLQLWQMGRTNRPERAVQCFDNKPISSVQFSTDGSRVAVRSFEDSKVLIYNAKPRLSADPMATCVGLPTKYEQANFCFSPDAVGKYGCGGATAMIKDETTGKLVERGSLNFYKLSDGATVSPIVALESASGAAGPVICVWHKTLNQILVGASNGSITVYLDPAMSKNGALLSLRKVGRRADTDGLTALLKSRAPQGLASLTGEILAPFAAPHKKRKRRGDDDEPPPADKLREPERPVSSKHKAGSQSTAATTLAQFIADQQQQTPAAAKIMAGHDPRQALWQYKKAGDDDDDQKVLDTKTMEQEEEEQRQQQS